MALHLDFSDSSFSECPNFIYRVTQGLQSELLLARVLFVSMTSKFWLSQEDTYRQRSVQ